MKVKASVLWETGDNWSPHEVELDPPKAGEVLVRVAYAGLCHSDEHSRRRVAGRKPLIGGHEAAGIVVEVGDGVEDLLPGDHVVFSFLPTCRPAAPAVGVSAVSRTCATSGPRSPPGRCPTARSASTAGARTSAG